MLRSFLAGTAALTALGLGTFAIASGAGLSTAGAMARLPDASDQAVRQALAKRLPKTQVSSIDCSRLDGLCEVVAGPNLFYIDQQARYLVIGRVYDMETRQDLTAARLLEINPSTIVSGAASADAGNDAGAGQGDQVRASATKVSLAGLPANGAIRWGQSGGPKVTVFSDVHCGFCRRLSDELRSVGADVYERPISTLGTRFISEAVLCARNPAAALHAAYAGSAPAKARQCDVSGLDANETFARQHGFQGTPVLVRADGAVIEGWRPASEITAWLRGAAA